MKGSSRKKLLAMVQREVLSVNTNLNLLALNLQTFILTHKGTSLTCNADSVLKNTINFPNMNTSESNKETKVLTHQQGARSHFNK